MLRRMEHPCWIFFTAAGWLAAGWLWCGCDRVCLDGRPVEEPRCVSSGTGQVTDPTGADKWAPAQIVDGATCLDVDGSCEASPMFTITAKAEVGAGGAAVSPDFRAAVLLLSANGTGTFTVPSNNLDVDVSNGPPVDPVAVSGQLDVQTSDQGTFAATFQMVIQNDAHQQYAVTGQVTVTCQLATSCSGSGS